MDRPRIHTAAPPVGLVQRCSRCLAVLIDDHGASFSGRPRFYSAGANVEVGEGYSVATQDAATCDDHPLLH